MSLKNKIENFNRRWNIETTESPVEAFSKFKVRVLNVLKDINSHLADQSISEFCQFYGIEETWTSDYMGNTSWNTDVINRLHFESNPVEFFKLLEVIFSLDITNTIGYDRQYSYSKNILLRGILSAVEYSNVGVSVVTENNDILFYPKGEEELDKELVNLPLSFLNKESGKHFTQALQFYQDKNHIKSAESLRRALEEFLRFRLKNTKGLDANITDLLKKLKEDKRDSQVRNIIFQTFDTLDKYFNENSKHNDGDIDDSENEFLIYQTGLLMRYINRG